MGRLCIGYIPKVKGENAKFRIVETLDKCMAYYSEKNYILSSPGYLSNTDASIRYFANEF